MARLCKRCGSATLIEDVQILNIKGRADMLCSTAIICGDCAAKVETKSQEISPSLVAVVVGQS